MLPEFHGGVHMPPGAPLCGDPTCDLFDCTEAQPPVPREEVVFCSRCDDAVTGRVLPHQRIAIPAHGTGDCLRSRIGTMDVCDCDAADCPDRIEDCS